MTIDGHRIMYHDARHESHISAGRFSVSQAPGDYHHVTGLSSKVSLVDYRKSGCRLAAKKIKLDNLSDVELELLAEGVRWTRMIRHRNILPFLSAFLSADTLWLLSPFCELGSAGDVCRPTGLEENIIAFVIRDTLLALEYLHQRGFVHRAVRGSHILIHSEGRCLLTGMEYSVNVVKDGMWHRTLHDYPKNAKSNLNWFSPELLEQNLHGYDFKSDVYSVGVTCCELANGVVPFDNLQPTKMLLDKLTGHHPVPFDSSCTYQLGDSRGKF